MNRKASELTEDKVFHIIRSKGEFVVNPYRTQGYQQKLVEQMRKQGKLLLCRKFRDHWVYTLPKVVR
jgi:hypothetical protein